MNRSFLPVVASCAALWLVAPEAPQAKAGEGPTAGAVSEGQQPLQAPSDVVARVGDQTVTFGEINTALNSSAVVGVSVPALGTPERDTVRVMLLDRLVSANLLYLDARKQGLDQDPAYRRQVERFDDAMLAGLYRQHILLGEIPVSEEEIQASLERNFAAGTELTPDLHASIESKLRREKVEQKLAAARTHIRDGVDVVVHEENLATAGDSNRADSVALADIDGDPLTWGAVKDRIVRAGKGAAAVDPLADQEAARRQALQTEIDVRIMANKARAAGLDQDPLFKARAEEFHKTRLINFQRERLLGQMEPTDEELKAYYEANQRSIVEPEARKIQMVVLKTKEEAEEIKSEIKAGKLTMYQAAQQHSIAAKAKENLGEVGWVYQGDTVPALDEAIFALGPGEISAPVETPAGWHLVTVQDVQEAKHSDFDDAATRKLTRRRYLDEKLNEYVVSLRKNEFPVEVYQDVLLQLAQQEADMVKELAEKAKQPGSITEQRVKELGKMLKPQ
jgi:parvulin-like peptidyl-prolyl isomerase